jgi:DNA-binding NarL/FixJ family response regulator
MAEEAIALFTERGYRYGVTMNLGTRGAVALAEGKIAEATEAFFEELDGASAQSDRWLLADALAGLAAIAIATNQGHQAAMLVGAVDSLLEAADRGSLPHHAVHQRAITEAKAAMTDAAYEAAVAEGRSLALDQVLSLTQVVGGARESCGKAPTAYGVLTPRELDVVRLIAAGMSNAEIADALFLSVLTVKRHLQNILGKLDLPSRSALNTWAHKHGLA